jgi:hypothetical protein
MRVANRCVIKADADFIFGIPNLMDEFFRPQILFQPFFRGVGAGTFEGFAFPRLNSKTILNQSQSVGFTPSDFRSRPWCGLLVFI